MGEVAITASWISANSCLPGYENLSTLVRIKASATRHEFAEIHEAVMATSPNFYNVSRPVALKPTLVVV